MKIETNDYLTPTDAAKELGCPRRTLYRAIERAEAAGVVCRATVLGKAVLLRAAMPAIEQHYFPYYSEQHQAMVKAWGAAGGKQKKINRERASSSGTSGGRAGGSRAGRRSGRSAT